MPNYTLARNRRGVFEIRWSERDEAAGRSRSRSCSTGCTDRAEAERFLGDWLTAQGAIRAAEGTPPVSEILRAYNARLVERGAGATTLQVLHRLARFFGPMRPGDIDDATLHAYARHRGIAPASLRRELNALKAAINMGVKKRLVAPGDVPFIELPPEGEARQVFLDPAQEARVLKAAMDDSGDRLTRVTRFVLIALRTGARRRAIHELTWDRVDLKGRTVDFRVPGARRTKKRRVPVPVDDVLAPVLERAAAEATDAFVIGAGDIRTAYESWQRRHALEWVTPHVLRHTAATRWLREGLTIWQVAGLLGDTVETTARVYGHHATEDLREAMSRGAGHGR